MKLSSLVSVFCLFLGFATANADQINLRGAGDARTLSFHGAWGGISNEIYSIMSLAGVQETPGKDGREWQGALLSVVVVPSDTQSEFSAELNVGGSSGVVLTPRDLGLASQPIVVTGEVAAELFADMEKAGLPRHPGVDGVTLVGTHVSCSRLIAGGARYSCRLQATDLPGNL